MIQTKVQSYMYSNEHVNQRPFCVIKKANYIIIKQLHKLTFYDVVCVTNFKNVHDHFSKQ